MASGSGETAKEKDTPSKKKKSRVAQLGAKDDDEVSVGGGKKAQPKKRKPLVSSILSLESRLGSDVNPAPTEQSLPPTLWDPTPPSLVNRSNHVPPDSSPQPPTVLASEKRTTVREKMAKMASECRSLHRPTLGSRRMD